MFLTPKGIWNHFRRLDSDDLLDPCGSLVDYDCPSSSFQARDGYLGQNNLIKANKHPKGGSVAWRAWSGKREQGRGLSVRKGLRGAAVTPRCHLCLPLLALLSSCPAKPVLLWQLFSYYFILFYFLLSICGAPLFWDSWKKENYVNEN